MPVETKQLPSLRRFSLASARALTPEGVDDGIAPVGTGAQYELSFSSETPVLRSDWFGDSWYEVLDHSASSVDLSRAQGMPLLLEHDPTQQIGVVDSLRLEGQRLIGIVRFSRSQSAIEQDVRDGIRQNVSIGYVVNEFELESGGADADAVYRAKNWQIVECSVVSIPADTTVGAGRSADKSRLYPVTVRSADPAPIPVLTTEHAPAPVEAPAVTPPNLENKDLPMQTTETGAVSVISNSELAEITRACAMAGHDAEVSAGFLQRGLSLKEVKAELYDMRSSKPVAAGPKANIELSQRERKQYSYGRAMHAALQMREGAQVEGCFELEINQELRSQAKKSGLTVKDGFMLPTDTRAFTPINSSGVGTGAEVVFQQQGEFIDLLRNFAIAQQLGITTLSGLVGPIGMPKQTGDSTAVWVSENPGVDVAASNLTLSKVTMSPETLMSRTGYTRQMLAMADTNYSIESIIRNSMAKSNGLAIDLTVFHGTGANNQPTGLYNLAGVGVHAVNGALVWDDLQDMITAVDDANALFGSLAFATNPSVAGKLAKTLVAQAAGANFIWSGKRSDGEVAGYRAMSSNQLSRTLGAGANENALLFGNFESCILGFFGAVEIITDPYSLKNQGLIEITSFLMADVQVTHPESFVKATGITTV